MQPFIRRMRKANAIQYVGLAPSDLSRYPMELRIEPGQLYVEDSLYNHERRAYIVKANRHKVYLEHGDWLVNELDTGKWHVVKNTQFKEEFVPVVQAEPDVLDRLTTTEIVLDVESALILPKEDMLVNEQQAKEKLEQWITAYTKQQFTEVLAETDLDQQQQTPPIAKDYITYEIAPFWGLFYDERKQQFLISVIPTIVMFIPTEGISKWMITLWNQVKSFSRLWKMT